MNNLTIQKAKQIRDLVEDIEALEKVKKELDDSGFHSGNFNGIESLRVAKTIISIKEVDEETNMEMLQAMKNVVSKRLNGKMYKLTNEG